MALVFKDVNPGGANALGGPFISSYTTLDAIAVIEGAGYFNDAATVLDNAHNQGLIVCFDLTNSLTHIRSYTVIAGVVLLIDPTIT